MIGIYCRWARYENVVVASANQNASGEHACSSMASTEHIYSPFSNRITPGWNRIQQVKAKMINRTSSPTNANYLFELL